MFIRPRDIGSRPLFGPGTYYTYIAQTRGVSVEVYKVLPTAIGVFSRRWLARLVESTHAQQVEGHLKDIYRGAWQGSPIDIIPLSMGAPAAVATVEELGFCGLRNLITFGTAGGLEHDRPAGSVVIPIRAIREEGTSYHYLPPGDPAVPDAGVVDELRRSLTRHAIVWREGPTWTTDGLYREFITKLADYRRDGCLTVEMECSAVFSACKTLNIRCAALLLVSDILSDEWRPAFVAEGLTASLERTAPAVLDAAVALAVQ